MIIHPNNKNKTRIKALKDKYDALIAEAEAKVDALRDPDEEPKEKTVKAMEEWIRSGSEAWQEARHDYFLLLVKRDEDRRKLIDEISKEEFDNLKGDKQKILAHAKRQAKELIDNRKYVKNNASPGASNFIDFDSLLDPQILIHDIKECIKLHYEFFKDDSQSIEELDRIVIDAVDKSGIEQIIIANYPTAFLTPIDKISNKAFEGILNSSEITRVEVIKKAKNREPIYAYAMVSIDTTKLKGVTISGREELTPYDREVHDAIVTLYVEGKTIYITPNMIYQAMTGRHGSHCSKNQESMINNSITKLMCSHVIIDAAAEAAIDNRVTRILFDSNAINAKRVSITINGKESKAIKILDTPILFDYAQQKNQIGRFNMKLLDTPNNKNEETIILEGYLRRRILAMRKSKDDSKLSNSIKYETVYKQLDISFSDEVIRSEAALRKKKLKVRESVKKALDYFKKEGFIKNYSETVTKGVKDGVSISF